MADGIGSSRRCLAEQVLELGEDLLNRIEIRRVFRQEDQFGADRSDEAAHGFTLMAAEIIHHDDVASLQGRDQHPLDVKPEALAIDGTLDQPGSLNAIVAQGSQEGHGFPVTVWNLGLEPHATLRPSPKRGHVGLGPGFVEKHQATGRDPVLILTPLCAPSRDVRTILFAGQHGFF